MRAPAAEKRRRRTQSNPFLSMKHCASTSPIPKPTSDVRDLVSTGRLSRKER
jgi:hypothetical protein